MNSAWPAAAIAFISFTATLVAAPPVLPEPSDIRGISWSDPRDNYNPAQIVPSGLSLAATPDQAAAVGARVARRTLSVGANVVRLGINPPTVADPAWWPVYQAAIRALTDNGVDVILCAWEQSPTVAAHGRGGHNGKFGAGTVETYAAMWKHVHEVFRNNAGVVGYELLNEPFGYRGRVDDYACDMRTLMAAIGDLQGKHVLVAGIGYSDNLQLIRDRFPEPGVWFAYHIYPSWFGGEAGQTLLTRGRYAEEMTRQLAGVEDRTVVTEFGCWGGVPFDYAKPSADQTTLVAKRHVAYLQAVADVCAKLKLGSIYWFADAREDRSRPRYDLFANDGIVFDADRLAEVQRAWRMSPTTATSRP